ncbi:metal-dependent phosphohydrolase HD sub domain [Solidesulfovibrio fructosivorans JJ]]|uniref:Metal-dependent phosphohydrolase HD sub domain n=1 Tax=Solidesulfovibrio fructosivorans JJ] TaxID=596151 RepID=E1JUG2_SOLFR|nr:HD domain-containing protein [Solidesulfovibrio fructosivorans]EFL52092.1 metal-dependent phosphohydrolase HD sub domain [Solidesulfovibrio fructosivorans JJ]]
MIAAIRAWFEAFVDAHRLGTPVHDAHLDLKRVHSLLVMDEAKAQAEELELPGRLRELAVITGLLHDTGRFPQYRRYHTFRDADSANHAILGTVALARENALAALDKTARALVRTAIICHNKRALPARVASGRDPDALTLARIVRDADKLDIVRVMLEHFQDPKEKDAVVFLGLPDIPDVYNPVFLEDIAAGRIGNYYAMGSTNDFALLLLSWINDMNFARTRREFFTRGLVAGLFDALPDQPELTAFKTRYHDRFAPSETISH